MSPTVPTQIAAVCLVQERQCPFAHTSQLREHGLFASQQFWVLRNGAFAPNDAALHQRDRQMKPLEEGYRQRRFSDNPIGISQDAAFHLAEVCHQLCSRPTGWAGRNVPLRWVYRISGGQETLLRAPEFFDCGFQVGHGKGLPKAKYYKSFTQPVLLRRSRRQLAQTRVPVEVFATRR